MLFRSRLASDGVEVDAICGGFPCQDISQAGSGKGLAGKRSGLWTEYVRLIGDLRPQFVIVENVSRLLSRGFDQVLGDLAALRYDAEWHCIPASAVGAPHIRDRVWIVAYPQHPDTDSQRSHRAQIDLERSFEFQHEQVSQLRPLCSHVADPDCQGQLQSQGRQQEQRGWACDGDWWRTEPDVGRVAYGVPGGVDRLKGLGNAVIPQIPEIIGRAIMNAVLLSSHHCNTTGE